jgi:L-threonylcarbamoyladenylate synthase
MEILVATHAAIVRAAAILQAGGTVAFPTDTVYGVGAHAFQPAAVEKLYAAKLRPRDKAIPLLLAHAADVSVVAQEVSADAQRLMARFWPGGLTLVLPRAASVPDIVCAGGESVAVRLPAHAVARALIAAMGVPMAATSANLSGHPSPVVAAEVAAELAGRIDLILDGGRCPGGVPSTVLDLSGEQPRLLRPGAIHVEEIEDVLGRRVVRE